MFLKAGHSPGRLLYVCMHTTAVRVWEAGQDGETPYMLRRLMMLSTALISAWWRAVPTQGKAIHGTDPDFYCTIIV